MKILVGAAREGQLRTSGLSTSTQALRVSEDLDQLRLEEISGITADSDLPYCQGVTVQRFCKICAFQAGMPHWYGTVSNIIDDIAANENLQKFAPVLGVLKTSVVRGLAVEVNANSIIATEAEDLWLEEGSWRRRDGGGGTVEEGRREIKK